MKPTTEQYYRHYLAGDPDLDASKLTVPFDFEEGSWYLCPAGHEFYHAELCHVLSKTEKELTIRIYINPDDTLGFILKCGLHNWTPTIKVTEAQGRAMLHLSNT